MSHFRHAVVVCGVYIPYTFCTASSRNIPVMRFVCRLGSEGVLLFIHVLFFLESCLFWCQDSSPDKL
jgi:hypothetical protein